MLIPWRSKDHVSEPADNLTSGNEDQDLRGGKRHKPNASGGVVQKDDEDAVKVSHADELPPYEEASDSNVGVSTLAKYSIYSGYLTDDLGRVKIVELR